MYQFVEDLKILDIDVNLKDSVTIRDVITAFRKKAKVTHPDKVGDQYTAEFQDIRLAYERALKYLVKKNNADEGKTVDDVRGDEEKFAEDNFDHFNFPKRNTDSFTIVVENELADVWQESFKNLFGEPIINKNRTTGTESGRVWKIDFRHGEQSCELTVHFYNKPVTTKKSKFLVQGGSHTAKYLFVFNEMPKIYKMVCEMKKIKLMTPVKHLKRRRISTTVKKRNVRHKPGKMIRHMKIEHTSKTDKLEMAPCVLAEDMTLCEVEDEIEKLLDEKITSEGVAKTEEEREILSLNEDSVKQKHELQGIENQVPEDVKEKHVRDEHEMQVIENQVAEEAPLPMFKCDECTYVTRTKENVDKHKVKKHANEVKETKTDKTDITVFMHTCISCQFNTNDYNILRKHIDETHMIIDIDVTENPQEKDVNNTFVCENCGNVCSTVLELEWHNETEHMVENGLTCIECEICNLNFSSVHHFNEHIKSHSSRVQCDQCECVFDDVSKFISHLQNTHKKNAELIKCQHCDFRAQNKDALYEHLENEHIEYAMLASVTAGQAEMITKFDQFKGEMCNIINKIIDGQNKIIDDQNIIKQELFILKNQKHNNSVDIKKVEDSVTNLTTSVNTLSSNAQILHGATSCPPEIKNPATFVTPHQKKNLSTTEHTPAQRAQVCIIGDSISGNIDKGILAKTMDADIRTVKAYSTLEDTMETEAKEETEYPDRKFQDVMKKEVENSDVDILIVQATSVDITNLKVSHDNSKKYSEFFKQDTIISASNLFTSVENTIKANPKIKKAIILKHIPRYDCVENDPLGIKAALSHIYNDSIVQQWLKSPLKDKIELGSHDLECTGGVRDSRYRSGRKFDGIHMRGPSGKKAYTESVLQILHNTGHIKNSPPAYFRRYHEKYTTQVVSQDRYHCPTQNTDYLRDRDIRNKKQNNYSRYQYTIPTSNRFVQLSQGNY